MQERTDCGCGSVVEHLLAKENVVGSNPITRFIVNLIVGKVKESALRILLLYEF